MLQNELDLAEKQKQMMLMHKTQHKVDKIAKDDKWSNYYGDKDPLPELWKT